MAPERRTGPVPMEILRGYPERTSPRISPDGSRLAFLAPHNGVMNIWVGTAAVHDAKPLTDAGGIGVQDFGWAYDARHVLFQQDSDGDEVFHVHSLDAVTGEVRDRTPFPGAVSMFVAASPRHPSRIVVASNRREPTLLDLYEVDLEVGTVEPTQVNPGFHGWLVDHDLQVRGGVIPRADGGAELVVRDGRNVDFRTFVSLAPPDHMVNITEVLCFDGVGDGVYVRSAQGEATTKLVRYNVATGARTVIAGDDAVDVMAAAFHPRTNEPQLVELGGPRRRLIVIDPSIEADIRRLEALDGGALSLVSRDQADQLWVVAFVHADGPTRHVLYDRRSQRATELFVDQPRLAGWTLADLEPFSFRARDGLKVHGYLAFPPGAERRDLPMVINVHGGPWGLHDWWWCHPEAQWAATRGYLHMQVNYRGSGGFGKAFLNASRQEFGGAMQHDLIDALEWAVAQGYADRDRVAIMGWSYGGYAALVGASFTPDSFRCAIAGVGPTNLVTLIESVPEWYVEVRTQWHKLMGHPKHDREFLLSRSPVSRVGDIHIPLLICQGANDPRVTRAETDAFVAELARQGVEHEYLVFDGEGHGLARQENRMAFYRRAEAFLAEHLVPRGSGG